MRIATNSRDPTPRHRSIKQQRAGFRTMSSQPSYTYTTPTDIDILGGRGSEAFYHQGNRKLRGTIDALLDRYNSLTHPKSRGAVVDEIVQSLIRSGGRFLKFHKEVGVIEAPGVE